VNEQINKQLGSLNAHDAEIGRLRHEIGNGGGGRKFDDQAQYSEKVSSLIEESNKLWAFFQKFIDEHAVDRMKTIRSKETTMSDKINAMDWLARYSEFVTPDQINNVVQAFKNLYNGDESREGYIYHRHYSEAVPTIIQIIRSMRKKKVNGSLDEETYDQSMTILLSILEPLMINE